MKDELQRTEVDLLLKCRGVEVSNCNTKAYKN